MASTSNAPESSPRKSQLPNGASDGILPASRAVPLENLLAYAELVIAAMAENRDIRSDSTGKPGYFVRSSGVDREASWVHFEADFSAIGMATDMPFLATAYADEDFVEWHFGPTPIATTPRAAPPQAAAEILEMNTLLDAFRRFVVAESVLFPAAVTAPGADPGGVFIDPEDGSCRECSGTLEVIGVDEATLVVACCACGGCDAVGHDAFAGERDYVLEFLSRRGWPAE